MNDPSILRIEDLLSKEELDEMLAFEEWAKRQSPFIFPDAFDKTVNWQNQEIMYRDDDVEAMFRSFCAGKRHDIWLPDSRPVPEPLPGGDPVEQMTVGIEIEVPDFEEVAARYDAEPPPRSPTTRALTRHVAPGMPHNLLVQVNDPVTAGGASYSYEIVIPDGTPFMLEFQSQEPELGINGITMEALLAICIDRLECFQKGPYPCRENALALTKIEEALLWLHRRTERIAAELDE